MQKLTPKQIERTSRAASALYAAALFSNRASRMFESPRTMIMNALEAAEGARCFLKEVQTELERMVSNGRDADV